MKLRTSFFKGITLKKDMFRFTPIWVLYLAGTMMVLISNGGYRYYDTFARRMDDMIISFGIVNILYAAANAALLYGDLYNTKMCYSLHAMPVRRESWLLTHLISGLLFSLVPNCLAAAYLMTQLQNYWFIALYWLLAVTLQYLFFYGVATVSALLTGNRFAMLAVYAGFNFIAMLLYATLKTIYVPMLDGVVLDLSGFSKFSPVVRIFEFDYFEFSTKQVLDRENIYSSAYRNFYVYEGLADGWGYLAILGALGMAAMAIAVWLYRLRKLEAAGDFVAFPRLKAPACVIITLCVTLCCAVLGKALFNVGYLPWMALGLVIGFFGSLMLLERRLRVFRKKTFLGFGALALAVALSLLAAEFDWLGIQRYIPKAEKIESVTVANYYESNYSYDYYYNQRLSVILEDEQDIAAVIRAHEDILENPAAANEDTYFVRLTYTLKSGRTVTRKYYAAVSGESYEIVRKYLYQTENLLGFADWQEIMPKLNYVYSNMGEVPMALWPDLMQALQKDSILGHVEFYDKGNYYVEYYFDAEDGNPYRSVFLNNNSEYVIPLLNSPQMLLGYSDWEIFLNQVSSVQLAGQMLTYQQAKELLEAVRLDAEAGTLTAYETYSSTAEYVSLFYRIQESADKELFRELLIDKEDANAWQWYCEHIAQ